MSRTHSNMLHILFALALAFPLMPNRAAATGESDLHPDLILFNGNIVTVNQDFEIAQGLALKGDKVALVGSNEDVLATKSPQSNLIDLRGSTVLPGLNDSHIHLSWMG